LRGAGVACSLVLLVALVGTGVRLLPWVLDPTIPWATLLPFAKSLLAVATEAAIVTGWPVGWALVAQGLVERGEALVLATLGERPERTMARLMPQAALFILLLAMTSFALGRDARAPGRVVDALVKDGRAACEAIHDGTTTTRAVPLVSATWLCGTGPARLVGRAPMGGAVFTAANLHVNDDLRRIDLDDAYLLLAPSEGAGAAATALRVRVHVSGSLSLVGMAPWARASSVPPAVRALVVATSGVSAACAVFFALLKLRRKWIGSIAAVGFGAVGPLTALFILRALELRMPEAPGLWLVVLALVPIAAVASVVASFAAVDLLHGPRAGRKA